MFPLILTKDPYPLASDNERRHTDLKKRNTVEKERHSCSMITVEKRAPYHPDKKLKRCAPQLPVRSRKRTMLTL
jgi:hypothetical protein